MENNKPLSAEEFAEKWDAKWPGAKSAEWNRRRKFIGNIALDALSQNAERAAQVQQAAPVAPTVGRLLAMLSDVLLIERLSDLKDMKATIAPFVKAHVEGKPLPAAQPQTREGGDVQADEKRSDMLGSVVHERARIRSKLGAVLGYGSHDWPTIEQAIDDISALKAAQPAPSVLREALGLAKKRIEYLTVFTDERHQKTSDEICAKIDAALATTAPADAGEVK